MIALILAGGGGTRLWPVSRKANPKQIEAFIGEHSMLKATFARVRQFFSADDIFVASSASHAAVVRAQLPELPERNLILEPCRRETAAAIGFALLQISRTRPTEVFVLINSDAHVKDEATYARTIFAAGKLAATGRNVLIGLTPSYPETGYGYIKMGEASESIDGFAIHAVERFVEKPDRETAERYLADGHYLWNATLLVAPVQGFLELYDQHLPEQAALFEKMRTAFDTAEETVVVESCFARLPAVSIDYGILEKAIDLAVLPADFGWLDIGNWRAVRDVLARRNDENVVQGRHVAIDSSGNLIHGAADKLIATIGISDLIIVDTGDALLICPRDRAHEVKDIVGRLKEDESLEKYL
ncbi:MAG: sugar phosphate nucleotidyltransferase [Patescibacteria group bacterium]